MWRIQFPRLFDPDSPIASRSVLFYPERERMAKMSVAVGAVFALAFALLLLVLASMPAGHPNIFYVTGYIAIAFLSLAGCASVWSGWRYLRSAPPQYAVEVTERGVKLIELKRTRTYEWREFASYVEAEHAFTLTLKGTKAQLRVPKSSMGAGEIAYLRARLGSHVPGTTHG